MILISKSLLWTLTYNESSIISTIAGLNGAERWKTSQFREVLVLCLFVVVACFIFKQVPSLQQSQPLFLRRLHEGTLVAKGCFRTRMLTLDLQYIHPFLRRLHFYNDNTQKEQAAIIYNSSFFLCVFCSKRGSVQHLRKNWTKAKWWGGRSEAGVTFRKTF